MKIFQQAWIKIRKNIFAAEWDGFSYIPILNAHMKFIENNIGFCCFGLYLVDVEMRYAIFVCI
jgi:hypothetical protein